MSQREPVVLSVLDRGYLAARATVIVVLAVLGALDATALDRRGGTGLVFAYWLGVGLVVLGGAVFVLAVYRGRHGTERALWEVLPLDLLGLGLLVWVTAHYQYQDPFYPWALGLSMMYAAATRRRRAWIVSGLAAAVYLLGNTVAYASVFSLDDYALLAFKSATLVFTGWMLADQTERQSVREDHLRVSQQRVAELNEQLSRRVAELHAISEITEVIHSTLDFEQVGPLVLDILSKVIDIPSSCVFVIDKDKDETIFSASAGLSEAAVRSYGDRWALASASTGPGNDELFACMTVLDHKRLMVVFCAPGDRLERMGSEDKLVLQAVASELVVAVENSQLYTLTKRLSITDELTGLYNYRYLQQRLDDEIERARRYGRSLSLLMLDADDFKGFNDTHGHIAGDNALAEMARVFRSAVREIDIVCRYGGEEFSVILPETDAEGAFVVAEKIREAVSSHLFADGEGVRRVRLTVSIGLATYPSGAADQEELLRMADDALYAAKNTGRDRVRAPVASSSRDRAGKAPEEGERE